MEFEFFSVESDENEWIYNILEFGAASTVEIAENREKNQKTEERKNRREGREEREKREKEPGEAPAVGRLANDSGCRQAGHRRRPATRLAALSSPLSLG